MSRLWMTSSQLQALQLKSRCWTCQNLVSKSLRLSPLSLHRTARGSHPQSTAVAREKWCFHPFLAFFLSHLRSARQILGHAAWTAPYSDSWDQLLWAPKWLTALVTTEIWGCYVVATSSPKLRHLGLSSPQLETDHLEWVHQMGKQVYSHNMGKQVCSLRESAVCKQVLHSLLHSHRLPQLSSYTFLWP